MANRSQIERNDMIKKLSQPVPDKFIQKRPGPGGTSVPYVEGAFVVDSANDIFKFDGWMSQIIHMSEDFVCSMSLCDSAFAY